VSLSDPELESEGFELETLAFDGGLVLALSGEFDLTAVDRFREAFDAVLLADQAEIIIDFSRLRFMDSSGIAQLIIAINRLATVERKLRACGISGQVERVLELVRVLERLHLVVCPPHAIAWPG
jgi:anti-anti-sigma factor